MSTAKTFTSPYKFPEISSPILNKSELLPQIISTNVPPIQNFTEIRPVGSALYELTDGQTDTDTIVALLYRCEST